MIIPRIQSSRIVHSIYNLDVPVLVVVGAAGIGKSTAIAAAAKHLRALGLRVGSGYARNPSRDLADPGAPLADALAQMVGLELKKSDPDRAARIKDHVDNLLRITAAASGALAVAFPPAALAGLLAIGPEAREWASRRRPTTPSRESLPIEPIRSLLLEGSGKTVIHIGDAQWLSDQTLSALHEAIVDLSQHLALILEVRSSAASAYEPDEVRLTRMVNEIRQDVDVDWVEVPPFSKGEVRNYVNRRLAPNGLPYAFAEELYQASGGNPMLVDLLSSDLIERDAIAPDRNGTWLWTSNESIAAAVPSVGAISSLLAGIWSRLHSAPRWMLGVLALNGRPMRLETVRQAMSLVAPSVDVLRAWGELVDRGILVEGVDGGRMQHDLWASYIDGAMPRAHCHAIHLALAGIEPRSDRLRAYHLAKGGETEAAGAALRRALPKALEDLDWLEVDQCLRLAERLHSTPPDEFLRPKILLLRHEGRTNEALVLVRDRAASLEVEVVADLIHLAGRFEEAHDLLIEQAIVEVDPVRLWHLQMRAAHHLKFVDPRRAYREFRSFSRGRTAPQEVEALALYTSFGTLASMLGVSRRCLRSLKVALQLATQRGDLDTQAKVCRKLGEIYCFHERLPLIANKFWQLGLGACGQSNTRQAAYLEVVSTWTELPRTEGTPSDVVDFYTGRRSLFARIGIRGWEAHCLLLLFEKLRVLGLASVGEDYLSEANQIYDEIGLLWGQSACSISRALSQGDLGLTGIRYKVAELGFRNLAGSGDTHNPLALLLP